MIMDGSLVAIRRQFIENEKKRFTEKAFRDLLFTKDELDNGHFSDDGPDSKENRNDVFRLRFELVGTDSLSDTEKKLAKAERSISREVLVQGNMSLRQMHYMIQRLFGWQNSHLHHFSLDRNDFDRVTAGRFGPYADLCGKLFHFLEEDLADQRWNDDYDGYIKFKTWLKEKYTGGWLNRSISDTWIDGHIRMEEFRQQHPDVSEDMFLVEMPDKCGIWGNMNKLCENVTVSELFTPKKPRQSVRKWKGSYAYSLRNSIKKYEIIGRENIIGLIEELQQARQDYADLLQDLWINTEETEKQIQKRFNKSIDEYLFEQELLISGIEISIIPMINKFAPKLSPYFKSINYSYDYGDGWEVRVSLIEAYSDNADACAKDEQLQTKLASVRKRKAPICVSADGLNVLDDCGGVVGFINMLNTIHGKDKEESAYIKSWASELGWTGRKSKPENML